MPKLELDVPEGDFDGLDLLMALQWVRHQRLLAIFEYEDKSYYAEKILEAIAAKYSKILEDDGDAFGVRTKADYEYEYVSGVEVY